VLIAVDAGNTNTTFGLFNRHTETPLRTWRASSARERTSDEWSVLLCAWLAEAGLKPADVTGLALSSVSPPIGAAIAQLGPRLFSIETMVVSVNLDLGIEVATDSPSEVGADRLVNAAEAHRRFGGPVIVVDMGTATKIEAIDDRGAFLGGVIAPGLGVSMESLASRAARLFAVPLTLPGRAIGRNTIESVQSGVVAGHLAMIDGMVHRVRDELGGAEHVILTGGFSHVIGAESTFATDVLPDLTLEGIAALHRRNRPPR
jgi:type III pantothenate kinase